MLVRDSDISARKWFTDVDMSSVNIFKSNMVTKGRNRCFGWPVAINNNCQGTVLQNTLHDLQIRHLYSSNKTLQRRKTKK